MKKDLEPSKTRDASRLTEPVPPARIFLQNEGDGYDLETWEGAAWRNGRLCKTDVEYIRADMAPESKAPQGPTREALDPEIEKVWKDFWADIVAPGGVLNLDQVKKELFDFSTAMDNVPKVYMHITGHKLSKISYPASVVIGEADDQTNQLIEEARKEWEEETRDDAPLAAPLTKPGEGGSMDPLEAKRLAEIWIGYSELRFKPICFQTAKDAHEWIRSVPRNYGKCSVKHYRQVRPLPLEGAAPLQICLGCGDLHATTASFPTGGGDYDEGCAKCGAEMDFLESPEEAIKELAKERNHYRDAYYTSEGKALEGAAETPQPWPMVEGHVFDYAAAARSITLNLADFLDGSLPPSLAIADAARKAKARVESLEAEVNRLHLKLKLTEGAAKAMREGAAERLEEARLAATPGPVPPPSPGARK